VANGLLVIEGVTLEVWNALLERDHAFPAMLWYEDQKVFHLLKFELWLKYLQVYIIELPSTHHSTAASAIQYCFAPLCNSLDLKPCQANSMHFFSPHPLCSCSYMYLGWVGADSRGREADVSFRPFLGAAPLPPGVRKEVCNTLTSTTCSDCLKFISHCSLRIMLP
jgi:hypothetical protein